MKFQSQGLPKLPEIVLISSAAQGANVTSSHVFYKLRTNNDDSPKMRAFIAPHSNKHSGKVDYKTDLIVCSPVRITILLSLATMLSYYPANIDYKSGFFQKRDALRDV